jgi:hypothetical protein
MKDIVVQKLLLNGKSIKQEKDTVKKNDRTKVKETEAIF